MFVVTSNLDTYLLECTISFALCEVKPSYLGMIGWFKVISSSLWVTEKMSCHLVSLYFQHPASNTFHE